MKLKYELYFTHFGNHCMGVATGNDARKFNSVLHVNETAHDILKHMGEDISMDELVKKVQEEYDSDEATIREAIEQVLEKLRAEDILIE